MYGPVAIVKPDHIGDLVLSIPAIRAILGEAPSSVLFVAPQNAALANSLFPATKIETIEFPHLKKTTEETAAPSIADLLEPLANFELVVFLRSDEIIQREQFTPFLRSSIYSLNSSKIHETVLQRDGIGPIFGHYNPAEIWTPHNRPYWIKLDRVGLSIGSGFPANKWSVIRWTELAKRLAKVGSEIFVLGGPGERRELEIIAEAAELAPSNIIEGRGSIDNFLKEIEKLDVVVASDGGTGHLCSLVVPVLTIAASVPFRRYAPFGCGNRVVSLDLACSPCMNFHPSILNACFSYECSFGIQVEHIIRALEAPRRSVGEVVDLGGGAKLFYSPSHSSQRIHHG